ncbi:hypothetical protein GGI22_003902, partial [Coemansia erecta]
MILQRLRRPATSGVLGLCRRGVADKATQGTAGEQQLYDKLASELQPTRLAVTDSSGGCGSMYVVEIEAEQFRELSRVKQTKLVTSLLKQEIQAMHGIRMLHELARVLRTLDGFPKVDAAYRATTAGGGIASVVVLLLMAYMAGTEISEYVRYRQAHRFVVDTAVRQAVYINVDVTVAMPCALLRVNVADAGGDASNVRSSLRMSPVPWAPRSSSSSRESSELLRQGHRGIHVHDLIAKAGRRRQRGGAADSKLLHGDAAEMACRIAGSVRVNKVAGLLHITASRGGMGHLGGAFEPRRFLNFTHAIDALSFGPLYPGIANPLDSTLHIAPAQAASFKYFVSVVRTT